MEPNQLPQHPEEQGTGGDHLLEDLAAITSLLNPAQIWQLEEKLDVLDEQAAADVKIDADGKTPAGS